MLNDQMRDGIREALKTGQLCFTWSVYNQQTNTSVVVTQNEVREYIEELEKFLVKLSINALRNS